MYFTIRKYRKVVGDRNQVIEKVRDGFVPLISKLDGFVDYYCIFSEDGSLVSVSVFQDAAGAENSVRAAADWVSKNLAEHLPEKPELISGDVFASGTGAEKKEAA